MKLRSETFRIRFLTLIWKCSNIVKPWATWQKIITRGTVAVEVILEITKVPFVVKCGDCSSEYPESIGDCTQCRSCGSRNLKLVSGKEFLVEEIKIV